MGRGKVSLLVKRFPPSRRLHWKKRKALAAINNRRQWEREFDPAASSASEIELEHLAGYYLVTQSSTASVPNYIITE